MVLIPRQVRAHRERTTLVSTPTLIAPEAIRLLGDFAVPGEGVAVFAAISSFATAQYYPNAYPPSPLVSSAVNLAKSDLGEAARALPTGSVLLTPTDSHARSQPLSEDANAAIAVAAVAAVFEAAGREIDGRRDRILSIAADASRSVNDHSSADGQRSGHDWFLVVNTAADHRSRYRSRTIGASPSLQSWTSVKSNGMRTKNVVPLPISVSKVNEPPC